MGDAIASGGRPESETDTPVNIGNGPYCDNGEGVAARPLPYPLNDAVGVPNRPAVPPGCCLSGNSVAHPEGELI
jgi:hypothetical protein